MRYIVIFILMLLALPAAAQIKTTTQSGIKIDNVLIKSGNVTVSGRAVTDVDTLTSTAIDWSAGNVFIGTLTGDVAFTFSNIPGADSSQAITVRLMNDASGSHTVGWPSTVRWMGTGGAAPTMLATGNSAAAYHFLWDGVYLWGSYKDEEN